MYESTDGEARRHFLSAALLRDCVPGRLVPGRPEVSRKRCQETVVSSMDVPLEAMARRDCAQIRGGMPIVIGIHGNVSKCDPTEILRSRKSDWSDSSETVNFDNTKHLYRVMVSPFPRRFF